MGRIDTHNLSAVRIMRKSWKMVIQGHTQPSRDCAENCARIQAVYHYEIESRKQPQLVFGEFGCIEVDGKQRKLYAFSIILGFCRMKSTEFTTDISTETVI